MAAVVGGGGGVHQVGGPDPAGEAQHPRHLGHAGHIVGLGAVLDEQLGVVDLQRGLFPAHYGDADGAHGVDLCPVDGDLGFACGGDAGAVADEVVAAVADKIHGGVVDGDDAVAVHIHAPEVVGPGIDGQTVHGGVGDGAGAHGGGDGFLRQVLAVGDHNGVGHLKMVHSAVVFVVHLHGVADRQSDVSGIGSGFQFTGDAVHRQGQAFACGRGQSGAIGDGQTVQ